MGNFFRVEGNRLIREYDLEQLWIEGARSRRVYLPGCVTWKEVASGEHYSGGQTIDCNAPLDTIPLFIKSSSNISL